MKRIAKNSKALIALFSFLFCLLLIDTSQAHPAWAIAVDDRNQIYLSDLEKIWKIDATGKIAIFSERHTHEITFDRDGNLTGEELHYEPSTAKFTSAIWKITAENRFSYTLAPTENPPKGISIWKNRAGAAFYFGQTETEPREFYLLKRETNGAVKVLFGDREKALRQRQIVPYSFAGMTFAADDSLYFKNGTTVWKAAPDESISLVAGERQLLAFAPKIALFGLTIDNEKNVYTAEYNGGKILKIAPNGKISVATQTETGWKPTGVYYKNKNLYVLENQTTAKSTRVRKIGANGVSSIAAIIGEQQNAAPDANQNSPISSNKLSSSSSRKWCFMVALIAAAFAYACFPRSCRNSNKVIFSTTFER